MSEYLLLIKLILLNILFLNIHIVLFANDNAALYFYKHDGKWGYKNAVGDIIIKAKYDRAKNFINGLAPVMKKDNSSDEMEKWGYINMKDLVIIPFRYNFANEYSEGLANVYDEKGTKFIDNKGNTVLDLGQDTANDFHEGLAAVYIDRSLEGRDWQTKYINKKGETAFLVDGYGEDFFEGYAVLITKDKIHGEKCGFIDKKGSIIIKPIYAEAKAFSEGYAAVKILDNNEIKWGFIDNNGKYMIDPQYNEANSFKNGVAIVHVGGQYHKVYDAPPFWEGGEWQLIDCAGKILKKCKTIEEIKE
jgi:hypothetical protein